ncbi:MAG: cation:proton antiporter [Gammaproteobacteria bacterium]|nr:cation:proton antiporter [Gammaproteobacteria bacterium]MCY4210009.1 cation:proton antiporter [Gammaproteobacteria bacterium]MCY4282934.1 cation:proton antiporter [Gammaproteobacteria bacterium]MCY4339471.1 cation:proton antiporter [Gammaproteobacteria bacterium]
MAPLHEIGFSLFLIFTGAAALATVALYARQAIIVAYIILGVILGPWGLGLLSDAQLIADISHIGIIFLLYLLGLDLIPQELWKMLGEAMWVTLLSSLVFFVAGFAIALGFSYPLHEALLIGSIMMFSSTIIGVKLLPTTALHHRHSGQMIISVLLIQDLIAIVILLMLQGYGKNDQLLFDITRQLLTLPLLILVSWFFNRYVIVKLISRFDQIHEYIFLLAIAWCLAIAEVAALLGLSYEIGAFIAGITLASSPIAPFITMNLKPLRDFFLVLFFFSLGAGFNMGIISQIILPAAALAACTLVLKPFVFEKLFVKANEKRSISREVGYRLGTISEFSLLVAVMAAQTNFIEQNTSYMIQLATLITFVISSGIVVMNFRTPIAVSDRLRRD